MAKNDERNLNITLKSEQNEQDEVIISISTILKKLKKYLILWIVSAVVIFVLAFGYATITTHITKARLTALISFSYDGIEKGLDPDGRDFDVNSIKNPSIIESAIDELDLDMGQLEYIRKGISIEGIIPKNAIDRITTYKSILDNSASPNLATAQAMLDVTYYPTQYKVYFDYNETALSNSEALNVFNKILELYEGYFYQQYGYNESLGSAVTAIEYQDYDYSEAVDVFDTNLTTLKKYVRKLSQEDSSRFRSTTTGYTFDDLYEVINTISNIDLEKVSSIITVNNITKDKDEALAYYDYRIKSLTRQKAQYEEQISNISDSIEKYQKDEIFVFTNANDDSSMHSTVASEQYDKMLQQKIDLTSQLAEVKQRINYLTERQTALKDKKTSSDADIEKVEQQLDAVYTKINDVVALVNATSDDYYRNVTFKDAYNILVPATDTTVDRVSRIVSNAKTPLVMFEALGFAVYFAIAFIEALKSDSLKRKIAAEGQSEDTDRKKEDDEEKDDKKDGNNKDNK
ncbi:MAG: lipopolysaccharide biosynthesis protein [Ruminococcus sp.]|nr:lipopolysaccharide biosynthesis protein [Ruminococcus sp.]